MKGSCLCGAVTYAVTGPLRSVVGCHCAQCRKTSGHFVAATQAANDSLKVAGGGALRWYQSSETAERGFCATCGSSLFWRQVGATETSIMAGTLDGATGLTMDRQLYPQDKGDYYDLPEVEVVPQSSLTPWARLPVCGMRGYEPS